MAALNDRRTRVVILACKSKLRAEVRAFGAARSLAPKGHPLSSAVVRAAGGGPVSSYLG